MASTGRIAKFDADSGEGYIDPDESPENEDKIPFDLEDVDDADRAEVASGQRVRFEVRGGMAGEFAVHVTRISD